MPPKAKTATVPATSVQLCGICEPTTVDPSTTTYGCEHGTWVFDPSVTGPEATASEDELRAALLSSLDEATLRDLLAAKTGASEGAELTAAQKAAATKAAKAEK